MTTTAGQWIDLPTSGGGSDRLVADEPGGAGILQIASSNATHAARENGLRTLWEDYGTANVYTDLGVAGDASTFLWHGEDGDGTYVRLCGCFRVRLYGETREVPTLHLALRALAPATETTGIILAVMPNVTAPDVSTVHYGTVTTTSTTLEDLVIEIPLTPEMFGTGRHAPRDVDDTVVETGEQTEIAVWVGAWGTSGSGAAKGAAYGLTLSLLEPT